MRTDLRMLSETEMTQWIEESKQNGMEKVEAHAIQLVLLNKKISPENRYKTVKTLLSYGFDPSYISPDGSSLHLAAELHDLDIVKLLIKYHGRENLNINSKDEKGHTVLDIAQKNGDEDVEKYLKLFAAVYSKSGRTFSTEDEIGTLVDAIEGGGEETLDELENAIREELKADEIPEDIINNNKTLKEILSHDIGFSFHYAASNGYLESLEKYIDYARRFTMALYPESAEAELMEKLKNIITIKNESDCDALFLAFLNKDMPSENRYKIVELLLEIGFNPCTTSDHYGSSVLHLAAELGDLKSLGLLIQNHSSSSNFDINLKNADGLTPLDIANKYGHKEVVEYLISVGGMPAALLPPIAVKKEMAPAIPVPRATAGTIQEVKQKATPTDWAPKSGTVTKFRYKQIGTDEFVEFPIDEFGSFDRYKRTKKLGNGVYGTACLYEFVGNNTGLAKPGRLLSIVIKTIDATTSEDEINYEVNCTLVQNGWSGRSINKSVIDESEKIFIAAPFKPGINLQKYVDAKKINNLDDLLKVALALVKATDDFHQNGWVHGDLHLENAVIHEIEGTDKITIDLIDYGFSRPIGKPTKLEESATAYGFAPEVKKHINAARNQDVYRLGGHLRRLYQTQCGGQKNPDLEKLFNEMQKQKPEDRKKLPEALAELSRIQNAIKQSVAPKTAERESQISVSGKEAISNLGSSSLFGSKKLQMYRDITDINPVCKVDSTTLNH